ncbi:putative sulfate exporter family transporter [Methylobacterium sp. PvR107]|uniref:YeiH family protein n=1 Tax=Methylobacterium sp. PvR107 TaxID=2806597 RepID=UPI001AE43C92|nr:putative sulfate exporter family transporter [Methylobacterium sp. PvR107]MBP1181342.1 putative integral membrane protein (TIGR00698 family) [Methylobacterium sp. PvR107]
MSPDAPSRTAPPVARSGGGSRSSPSASVLPGIGLCAAITAVAMAAQALEERVAGHPYVEALVLAILIGIAVRTAWTPHARFRTGIAFSAKQLLEVAVVLLGASLSLGAILASGPALLAGIVATVVLGIAASVAICRALGLPARMAILVACGNAICGNSAIAAVAPVIGAEPKDIAAAIAFTAVLGVLMVLGLPLFVPLAGMNDSQYGVLAGLTVYAVPQVLAATVPVSLLSTQIGTLVKLVRVLMLGPVVVAFSLIAPRLPRAAGAPPAPSRPGLTKLVPWFILGFLALATLRSSGLVPDAAVKPLTQLAGVLTVLSMAALGLGVDVRILARVGGRVTLAVTASLAVLVLLSLALIRGLGIE